MRLCKKLILLESVKNKKDYLQMQHSIPAVHECPSPDSG